MSEEDKEEWYELIHKNLNGFFMDNNIIFFDEYMDFWDQTKLDFSKNIRQQFLKKLPDDYYNFKINQELNKEFRNQIKNNNKNNKLEIL